LSHAPPPRYWSALPPLARNVFLFCSARFCSIRAGIWVADIAIPSTVPANAKHCGNREFEDVWKFVYRKVSSVRVVQQKKTFEKYVRKNVVSCRSFIWHKRQIQDVALYRYRTLLRFAISVPVLRSSCCRFVLPRSYRLENDRV